MTAPGVRPITAMAVTAAFDDAERFNLSSTAGGYLGLKLWRCESGEIRTSWDTILPPQTLLRIGPGHIGQHGIDKSLVPCRIGFAGTKQGFIAVTNQC